MVSALYFGQGHKRVRDSAEKFFPIHALWPEGLLMLSCGVPSHLVEIVPPARWETTERLASVFYAPSNKGVFSSCLIGARHKSPALE